MARHSEAYALGPSEGGHPATRANYNVNQDEHLDRKPLAEMVRRETSSVETSTWMSIDSSFESDSESINFDPIFTNVATLPKPPIRHKLIFPELLMNILNDDTNADVLSWLPCGRLFTVIDYRKFAGERMEQIFNIRHMSSFVRKLSRWGFTREIIGGNLDIFRHENFQRDRPELCQFMRNVVRPQVSRKAKKPKREQLRSEPKTNYSINALSPRRRHSNHCPENHKVSPQDNQQLQQHTLSPVKRLTFYDPFDHDDAPPCFFE